MRVRSIGVVVLIGVIGMAGALIARGTDSSTPSSSMTTLSLVVVAGQSNAVGWGAEASLVPSPSPLTETSPTSQGPEPRIMWDQPDLVEPTTGPDPVPLSTPQDLPPTAEGIAGAIFGPEVGAAEVLGADHTLIVKVAQGSTSLAVDWSPSSPGGLYDQLVDEVAAARRWAAASDVTLINAGIIWVQGEQDALVPTDAASYQRNLEAFLSRLRPALSMPESTPIVIAQTSIEALIDATCRGEACGKITMQNAEVRAAQASVAESLPDTFLVDTAPLPRIPPGLHLSAQGELDLGRAAGKLLLEARERIEGTSGAG